MVIETIVVESNCKLFAFLVAFHLHLCRDDKVRKMFFFSFFLIKRIRKTPNILFSTRPYGRAL
jgi:hypothetical protein